MATPNLALSPVCRWAARYIHTSTHLYTHTHLYTPTPIHPYTHFPYPGVSITYSRALSYAPEYCSWLEGGELGIRYMTEGPVTPPYPPLGVVVYTARFL